MMSEGAGPLLVRGRWVVTGAGDDDPTISDGAVLVRAGTVEAVGGWPTLRAQHPDADVLGSPEMAVLPGLISAHHHVTGVTQTQHGIPDDTLELWLLELRRLRPSDLYLDTLLTAARLLRSGVTSVVEMHRCGGTAEASAARIQQTLKGWGAAGIRVAFAAGVADQNPLVNASGPGETGGFLGSLPPDARAAVDAFTPGPGDLQPDEYLGLIDDLWQQRARHPKIDVWFGPPGPFWVSDDFLVQIADRARQYGTGIQTHVSESFYEKLYGPRTYGRPVMLHLRDLGILSPRFTLAHAVWMTEAEIAALAETGTAVSHNPSSNLRLRAGIAPARTMLEAGVTVGLGLDARGLDDDDDIFREMRVAISLHRGPILGSPTLSPRQALHLATSGGAKLLGKEASLGRLAPGYAADLVLLDTRRLSWPWVAPEADPRDLLVLRAQARDVQTVLIGGEVVLRDGLPTGFDLEEAGREVAARLAATALPSEAARRVDLLREHVAAFYRAWDVPPLDGYVTYNSRS
jgi:cytosine/adenosine deaminase-related metal-dependent hydrolase